MRVGVAVNKLFNDRVYKRCGKNEWRCSKRKNDLFQAKLLVAVGKAA